MSESSSPTGDELFRRKDDSLINYRLDEMARSLAGLTKEVHSLSTSGRWINADIFKVTIDQLTSFISGVQVEYRTDIKELKEDLLRYQERQGRLWLAIIGSFIAPVAVALILFLLLGTK